MGNPRTKSPWPMRLREHKCNDEGRGSLECWVVLRDLGPGHHQRYVVHLWTPKDQAYFWGNYFREIWDAESDWRARAKRWATGDNRLTDANLSDPDFGKIYRIKETGDS